MLAVFLIGLILIDVGTGICKNEMQLTENEKMVLEMHNKFRQLHEETEDLCYGKSSRSSVLYSAQSWSYEMLKRNQLGHSEGGNYGENVWWGREEGDCFSAYQAATNNWYREIENWNFTAGVKINVNKDALHFTQVVWKSTTEVNCGFARNKAKGSFVTCQYYKRGNYATTTARIKNVRPLKEHVTDPVTEVTKPVTKVTNPVTKVTKNATENPKPTESDDVISGVDIRISYDWIRFLIWMAFFWIM